ncbi:MAG: alpha-glucosidase C-terminal domain-containing protein [Clostridiales bacterium]|nr:alpha-glucosidase C-terminal domain-containing protein [Clostridiales bacterium]
MDAGNDAVLTLGRYKDGEKLYGLYNFSPEPQTAWLTEPGPYRDLRTGAEVNAYGAVTLEGYGFLWLLKRM